MRPSLYIHVEHFTRTPRCLRFHRNRISCCYALRCSDISLPPKQWWLTSDDVLLGDCHRVDGAVLRLKFVDEGKVVAGLPDMNLVVGTTVQPDLDVPVHGTHSVKIPKLEQVIGIGPLLIKNFMGHQHTV